MEFRYPEESNSKSSSEETDRSEVNDNTGIGRSYECVFCKRGFTTAQALGGHMNIHRKDRAKTKPSFGASSSSKVDEGYVDLGLYSPIPRGGEGIRNYYSSTPEVDSSNYPQIYYPSPSTIRSPSEVQYADRDVFGEDWRRSLSLYNNPFYGRQNEDKVHTAQEDELDLELRLGYQP